jgi:chorismate dehydratase
MNLMMMKTESDFPSRHWGELMQRWHRILGRVSFVNCDPIYHDLPDDWDVLSAPPAWLTGHLLRKDCLVAPIPAADFASNADQLQLLSGVGIASKGAVGSVLLFGDRDPSQMRDIALPTDSATSRRLLMHLLGLMGLEPRPVDMGPDLGQMLERCDGALLIGDRALDEATRHPEWIRMDLGQAWQDQTGLPMVFGVFAAHRDAPAEQVAKAHALLMHQLDAFENDPDRRRAVVRSTAERSGFHPDRIERYFGEVIHRLDQEACEGLERFLKDVCGIENWQSVSL